MKKINFILCSLCLLLTNPAFAFLFGNKCQLAEGITINTASHQLTICANNKTVKEFPISLGRGGIGKKKRDDKKTPLGLYGMDSPRKSQRFGVFIPIRYPTPEQRAAGLTGSDVGIHGPIQKHTWLKWLNQTSTAPDWTFGCIAVATNSQINYIANWIAEHPKAEVIIS